MLSLLLSFLFGWIGNFVVKLACKLIEVDFIKIVTYELLFKIRFFMFELADCCAELLVILILAVKI